MLTLVIGNKMYSSWSLRPWLLLTHFGVAFDERVLMLDSDAFRSQIGRWSPSGQVPALQHVSEGGAPLQLWDSLAICEYVNETFLDGRGWPADPRARAVARAAAAQMHSGFTALRTQLPMNCGRRPNGYRWDAAAATDIARVQQLWRDLRAAYGVGGPFLCGAFGIVDAMFAPVVVRFRGYGVELDADAAAYVDALYALPALQAWIAAAIAEPERLAKYESLA